MSYRSRLYNHRNAQTVEGNEKPFFSKKRQSNDAPGKSSFFQAKLSVNAPSDKYEQEADAVADKVVANKPASDKPAIQRLSTEEESKMPSTNEGRMAEDKRIQEKLEIQKLSDPEKDEEQPSIQKMDEPKKEEEKPVVQKMDADPEKEKLQKKDNSPKEEEDKTATSSVQTKPTGVPATAPTHVDAGIKNTTGQGKALAPKVLGEMNSSFGTDFNKVRIHDDSEAIRLNKSLIAQAFTHGNDIYFNSGKYDTNSNEGKHLLAHELTHVVQQNQHQALQKKGDPRAEAEAKYSILIQVGDKDWAPSELDMLYTALKSLSKDEATVLRKYRFIRWESKASRAEKDPEYKNIKSDECGLHEADLKNGVYKISMYDACFADPQAVSQKTAGIDTGQFHILHEIGHAMQQAELRNKTEDSHEKNSRFNQAVEAYNTANAKAQGKMKPGVDKLDAADAAAVEAVKKSEGRSLKDLEQLIDGKKPLTDYSEKNSKEAFAEAFAIYKADPAGFKEINPVLYEWFSSGGYLKPPVKK